MFTGSITRITSGLMATLLLVTVHLAVPSPVVAADLAKGMAAYTIGDYETTFKEWLPLASAGDVNAQLYLGFMYADGQGVPQNYIHAATWTRRAAEQGDDRAQNNLGVMYEDGHGVPQDFVQAHMWYSLAIAQGNRRAIRNRNNLVPNMSSQAVSKAQALARQCLASTYQDCGN